MNETRPLSEDEKMAALRRRWEVYNFPTQTLFGDIANHGYNAVAHATAILETAHKKDTLESVRIKEVEKDLKAFLVLHPGEFLYGLVTQALERSQWRQS